VLNAKLQKETAMTPLQYTCSSFIKELICARTSSFSFYVALEFYYVMLSKKVSDFTHAVGVLLLQAFYSEQSTT